MNTPELYAKGAARLEVAANDLGRDGAEIHRAYLAFYPVFKNAAVRAGEDRVCLTGSAAAIRDDIGAFAKEGVETIVFSVGGRELSEILDNIAWLTGDVLAK